MGIISFLKRIFGKKEKVLIKKYTSQEQIKEYPKVYERNKQNLMGQLAAEKLKNKQATEQKKKERPKVAEVLAKQQRAIELAPYLGGFSWSKMFSLMKDGRKFKVVSYNFKKNFGQLHDMATLRDGRWALFVKTEKGTVKALITGSTAKDLFTNFGGLINSVNSGFFIVNLDENGKYVENLVEKEVPRIIADGRGKYLMSHSSYEPILSQMTELHDVISAQDEVIKTYEETLNEMQLNKNTEQLNARFQKSRADTNVKETVGIVTEAKQKISAFNLLERNNAISADEREIDEKRNEKMENVVDTSLEKLEKNLSKTEFQKARGMILDTLSWYNGINTSIGRKGLSMEEVTNLVSVLSKDIQPQPMQPQPIIGQKTEEKEKVSFL